MGERKPTEAAKGEQLAERLGRAGRDQELHDPDAGRSPVDRWINRIAEVIGVAVIATIVALIFLNAVGRYAFAAPILWAEELVIALIPWLAMTGVFLSVRRRAVIRIDHFSNMMPSQLRSPLSIFGSVLASAAFVYLAIHSFDYVTLFGGDPTTYLELPTGWFTSAMLIGAAASALAFLVDILPSIRAGRRP
ncbi:MAG: TRAP transporter small permease [Alphaproteobacteria bacterium]|nr:TRAP transporter small permease [Alphaproteobacteria bacterium]